MEAGAPVRPADAGVAIAPRPFREPSRVEVLRESVRLACGAVANVTYLIYSSASRFRFRWLERQGRQAEVEAIIRRMTLYWTSAIYRRLRCQVEVEGLENVPREGPVLVMPNHQSLYDIPLLMGWLGRPVGFVFKRELLRIPALHYWMLKIHGHAIDRGEYREAAEQYDRWGDELLATRRALVLFPEGTRSRDPDGALGHFRRGALRLASPRGIPVLPVVIDGTRFLVRPRIMAVTPPERRVVRMRILPPIATQPVSAPEAKRFMEELRETMLATREAIRVDWSRGAP